MTALIFLNDQGNILVDSTGAPRICDFGISKIMDERGFTTHIVTGTPSYMVPELFPSAKEHEYSEGELFLGKPTKESDVYTFGLVALRV